MSAGPQAFVIGWPIKHSRSPVIHRHWLREYGLEGDYRAVAVEPDHAESFLSGLATAGFIGGNVTVPHKPAAFRSVQHHDHAARATGAVNTVWIENGTLHGMNTDPFGFLANLDDAAPEWDSSRKGAVVLGAGGAARGVAWALVERGFTDVVILNRTLLRAEHLAADLGPAVIAYEWPRVPEVLESASVLVNTTTLGMEGQPPLDIDLAPLPSSAVVNDIVYTPLVTPLLADAAARGCRTVDGLGMLLHQAVPGFERWFGIRPKVTAALRDEVLATLGQTS